MLYNKEQNYSKEKFEVDDVVGDTLEDNRELLSAKRKNERMKAYKFLIKNISEEYQNKFLENSSETLFEAIINSCKKGDVEEKTLALTLAAVLFISVDLDRVDDFVDSTKSILTDTLKSSKDNLKSVAASALSISTALSANTSSETLERTSLLIFENLKSSLEELGTKDHQPLVLHLRSWSFLISILNPQIVEEKFFVDSISFLVTLLDDQNVQVRLTAAQTIVMIFEVVKQNSDEEFDLADYENVFDLDEMLDTLRQKNSKIELAVRRKFERIVEVIESNLEVEINEEFSGNLTQIKIESWTKLIQLEYFIELIGTGLVSHFSRNASLKKFLGNQKEIKSIDQHSLTKSKKKKDLERKKMRDMKSQNNY